MGNRMSVIIATFRKSKAKEMMVRGVFASFLGLFVIACTGCGGGGGGGSDQKQSTLQTQQPKTVLIESYGDSTTAGYQVINGVGSVTKSPEPLQLQSMLRARFGNTAVTVSNEGVSGTEASNLLNGTDGVHAVWTAQMANSKAQIVTLNFALNDAYYVDGPTATNPAESPSEYASIVTQLVTIARESGKQVVLYEPNPTCQQNRSQLPAYVAALRQVASQLNVPVAAEYDTILGMSDWQSLLTDCLHPTDVGYQVKAQLEFPVVSPMVQSLLQ